ncbi:MAG: DNA repair protein RecN [Nitrospiria bacterium]
MLRELRIKNYALIDEAALTLSEGFNVITGETGAGKSILIGALSLILGERSFLEGVRCGASEALLEAAFDPLPPEAPVETDRRDEDDDEILLIKRIISKTGKNRAYFNGGMATLAMLKDAGQRLVEVHGQQGQHRLTQPDWQRTLLDNFGGLTPLRRDYQKTYQEWFALKKERDDLVQQISNSNNQTKRLSVELAEIRDARLSSEEETELEREERTLKQWERMLSAVQTAQTGLTEEGGVLSRLDNISHALQDLNTITRDADGEAALCGEAEIQLKELANLLRARTQEEAYFPDRLEAVSSRLFLIQQLKRKYQRTVPELLAYQQELEEILSGHSEDVLRLKEVEEWLVTIEKTLTANAKALSQGRAEKGLQLQARVKGELAGLGMAKTDFSIVLQRIEPAPEGMDQVAFLIALPGEAPRGLSKIASGGELSRIMLALKVVLAEVDPVPTFVFDEVDAGVGGGIAERVGRRLFSLSKRHQVLCITHLPQIASLADHHYFVEKKTAGDRIVTTIRELSYEERVEELARMLGGVTITDLTRRHAEEMIGAR